MRQAAHTSQQPWLLQPRATVASPGEACSITRDSSRVGRPGLSPGWLELPFRFWCCISQPAFPLTHTACLLQSFLPFLHNLLFVASHLCKHSRNSRPTGRCRLHAFLTCGTQSLIQRAWPPYRDWCGDLLAAVIVCTTRSTHLHAAVVHKISHRDTHAQAHKQASVA